MELKILLGICFLTVFKVNCIELEGPGLVTYRPCGLGLIKFDKQQENIWKAVLDLKQYQIAEDADIVLHFKENIIYLPLSSQHSITKTDDRTLKIHVPLESTSSPILFHVRSMNIIRNTQPLLEELTINDYSVCNDVVRALHTTAPNVTDEYSEPPPKYECGRRSIDHEEFVSVRTVAKAGDWPWQAVVYIGEMIFKCGGVIISETAVITATFCIKGKPANEVTVKAGVDNLESDDQPGIQILKATEIVQYPSFDGHANISNLAIIKVNKLELTKYVRPICLWGPLYDKNLNKEYTIFTGFGEIQDKSHNLRATDVKVQDDADCKTLYTDYYTELTFCAEPPTNIKNTKGDGGGALMEFNIGYDQKITWYLRGIHVACYTSDYHCTPDKYSLYSDIAPYYAWIYHHSGLNELLP